MDDKVAAEEMIAIAKVFMSRAYEKGGKIGENFDLVVAIAYLGTKVDDLINAIKGIPKEDIRGSVDVLVDRANEEFTKGKKKE